MKIVGIKLSALVMMIFVAGCSLGDQELKTDAKDSVAALSSSRCELVPDAGTCEAYMIRYYFDPVAKKCKEFVWGGCDGVVPFETMEECQVCLAGR